jgi:hypothetical protein
MREPFEYRGDDVPGTKDYCISYAKEKGRGDLLPHLSLILDFVAQVEDQLPILSCEVLIGRFS